MLHRYAGKREHRNNLFAVFWKENARIKGIGTYVRANFKNHPPFSKQFLLSMKFFKNFGWAFLGELFLKRKGLLLKDYFPCLLTGIYLRFCKRTDPSKYSIFNWSAAFYLRYVEVQWQIGMAFLVLCIWLIFWPWQTLKRCDFWG